MKPQELSCRLHKSAKKLLVNKSGTAAIEMALVFPLFLTLCLGILAFGIYFGATHSVQQLAADAARYSVAGLNTDERIALTNTYVAQNASKYLLLDARNVKVASTLSEQDASNLVVRVTYDAKGLPIWRFVKFVQLPSPLIARVAVVHRGGA